MKTPTRQAPHICDQVLAKMSRIWPMFTRIKSTTTIQEARIAEPPTKGLKSKAETIVAPGVIEEAAETARCSQLMPGSGDQGPVQATTTAMRTRIGSQPWKISVALRPWASALACP